MKRREQDRAGTALPVQVAGDLAQRIRRREYPRGDRLPSERELSAAYGVSRPVIREALSLLKSDGLVDAQGGSGVYVSPGGGNRTFRMQPVAIDDGESLAQVLELLMAVEVAATRSAATHRNGDDLKAIRRELIGMEYALACDLLGDDEDFAFHQAIVAATHNPYFIDLCRHLEYGARTVIRRARTHTRAFMADRLQAVQDEHQAIYQAIARGDPEDAAQAAGRHLSNAAKRVQLYRRQASAKA